MDAGVLLELAFDLDSVPRSNSNNRFDLKTFFCRLHLAGSSLGVQCHVALAIHHVL